MTKFQVWIEAYVWKFLMFYILHVRPLITFWECFWWFGFKMKRVCLFLCLCLVSGALKSYCFDLWWQEDETITGEMDRLMSDVCNPFLHLNWKSMSLSMILQSVWSISVPRDGSCPFNSIRFEYLPHASYHKLVDRYISESWCLQQAVKSIISHFHFLY